MPQGSIDLAWSTRSVAVHVPICDCVRICEFRTLATSDKRHTCRLCVLPSVSGCSLHSFCRGAIYVRLAHAVTYMQLENEICDGSSAAGALLRTATILVDVVGRYHLPVRLVS